MTTHTTHAKPAQHEGRPTHGYGSAVPAKHPVYVASAGLFGFKRKVIHSLTRALSMSYKRQESIKSVDGNHDQGITNQRLLPNLPSLLLSKCSKFLNMINNNYDTILNSKLKYDDYG